MSGGEHLSLNTTLSLMKADLSFFRNMALDPRLEPYRFINMFALMPFLSSFVLDSSQVLNRYDPGVSKMLRPYATVLRDSRQRLKPLDDRKKSSDELLADALTVEEITSRWFAKEDPRMLDLGIFLIEGHMVGTVHVSMLNLAPSTLQLSDPGGSFETLGSYMFEIAKFYGSYTRSLLDAWDMEVRPFGMVPGEPLPPIGYRDLRSSTFYQSMEKEVTPRPATVGMFLTLILSQVNTARILVPLIAGANEVSDFKMKFTSLFHATGSLQRLLDMDMRTQGEILRPLTARRIADMLGTPTIRAVRRNIRLRNTLLHYGVEEREAARLAEDAPLFGLIEAHDPGRSMASFMPDIELSLDQIAEGLRTVLVPTLSQEGVL